MRSLVRTQKNLTVGPHLHNASQQWRPRSLRNLSEGLHWRKWQSPKIIDWNQKTREMTVPESHRLHNCFLSVTLLMLSRVARAPALFVSPCPTHSHTSANKVFQCIRKIGFASSNNPWDGELDSSSSAGSPSTS